MNSPVLLGVLGIPLPWVPPVDSTSLCDWLMSLNITYTLFFKNDNHLLKRNTSSFTVFPCSRFICFLLTPCDFPFFFLGSSRKPEVRPEGLTKRKPDTLLARLPRRQRSVLASRYFLRWPWRPLGPHEKSLLVAQTLPLLFMLHVGPEQLLPASPGRSPGRLYVGCSQLGHSCFGDLTTVRCGGLLRGSSLP